MRVGHPSGMHNMLSYVSCAILILLPILYRIYHSTRGPIKIIIKDFNDIRTLLAPQTPLPDQLAARAISNTRLWRVFRINSTFTSPSPQIHTTFTRSMISLIAQHGATYPWPQFAAVARISVDTHLPYKSDRSPIAYDTLVQIITLRVILIQLLGADPAALMGEEDLAAVAFGIGELWRVSKTNEVMPHLLDTTNAHLRRWLPTYDNAIEFVIPAYETMWRVVAITVAYANNDPAARQVFEDFMALPDSRHFRASVVDLSVEGFVREVLRLHPPTRHISRVVRVYDFPFPIPLAIPAFYHDVTFIADVETVQRDPGIWGPTANTFDPTRFRADLLTPQQERAMLVFGHGPLSCVARNWAPLAAAIIAGAVLERVGPDSEFELVEGPQLGRRDGWNGWGVREVD